MGDAHADPVFVRVPHGADSASAASPANASSAGSGMERRGNVSSTSAAAVASRSAFPTSAAVSLGSYGIDDNDVAGSDPRTSPYNSRGSASPRYVAVPPTTYVSIATI